RRSCSESRARPPRAASGTPDRRRRAGRRAPRHRAAERPSLESAERSTKLLDPRGPRRGTRAWYPSIRVDASKDNAINGDAAALSIDRAVGELRRGRAIRIVGGRSPAGRDGLVVTAVEAVQAPLVRRLERAADGPLLLCLTPERARAVR